MTTQMLFHYLRELICNSKRRVVSQEDTMTRSARRVNQPPAKIKYLVVKISSTVNSRRGSINSQICRGQKTPILWNAPSQCRASSLSNRTRWIQGSQNRLSSTFRTGFCRHHTLNWARVCLTNLVRWGSQAWSRFRVWSSNHDWPIRNLRLSKREATSDANRPRSSRAVQLMQVSSSEWDCNQER